MKLVIQSIIVIGVKIQYKKIQRKKEKKKKYFLFGMIR